MPLLSPSRLPHRWLGARNRILVYLAKEFRWDFYCCLGYLESLPPAISNFQSNLFPILYCDLSFLLQFSFLPLTLLLLSLEATGIFFYYLLQSLGSTSHLFIYLIFFNQLSCRFISASSISLLLHCVFEETQWHTTQRKDLPLTQDSPEHIPLIWTTPLTQSSLVICIFSH